MWAIEKLDVESVRLARAEASLQIKNDDGFNAVGVANNTGERSVRDALRDALKPEEEQANFMRLASGVITFIRHVVSWVNEKF